MTYHTKRLQLKQTKKAMQNLNPLCLYYSRCY